MKEFWEQNKKWIIWGLIIIAAIIIIGVVSRIIKNQKRKNLFATDYNNLIGSGQKPSYPETSYLQMADKIEEAGCPSLITACYGTDEESIFDVFDQMNNELDVLLLVKAFGKRAPRGTVWVDDLDLGGFLQSELDGEDIKSINSTLSKKGIKYRF